MNKIDWKKEGVPLCLIAVMFVVGIATYHSLPERIPIHWNLQGHVDGYLPKNPLSAFALPATALAVWILFLALPAIDPKREKYSMFAREYATIESCVIGFFFLIHLVVVLNSTGCRIPVEKTVPGAISLLFVVMGNLMGKIRQNYFVGIKLPWTLADERVWNKTHRLGGKLFVAAGILGLVGLFFPPAVTMILLMAAVGGVLAATILYSYISFKKVSPPRNT